MKSSSLVVLSGTSLFLFASLTAFTGMTGCSSRASEKGSAAADSVGSAGSLQTEVVGTWTDPSYSTDGAPFQGITLGSDMSFSWTAPCTATGCLSIRTDSGTWAIGTSGPQLGAPAGAPQLQLTDEFNQEQDLFVSVSADGSTMTLATAFISGPAGAGFAFQQVADAGNGGGGGQQGDQCGGNLSPAVTCAAGLTCVVPSGTGVAGQTGSCQPDDAGAGGTGQQGDQCGGNLSPAVTCAAGLTCVVPSGTGVAGQTGSCQPDDADAGGTGQEGDQCGGNLSPAVTCAAGLTCVVPSGTGVAGQTGTCEPDDAG